MHVVLDVIFVLGLSAAFGAQMLRWLRVLQREHYEASALARFVGRWSSPQVAAVPRSKVRLEQASVTVRTAPRDDFQGASRFDQDRLRPKAQRGVRRPFTLTHVLIFAFVVALLVKNEYAPVAVAVIFGLFTPWGLSIKGRTGPLVWTRRATTTAAVATVVSVGIACIGLVSNRPWLPAAVVVWGPASSWTASAPIASTRSTSTRT